MGGDNVASIRQIAKRKRMIRDLPPKIAKYLHPSLRSILISRQKRWNRGSPHFRQAVNLINRYCRPIKPRVLPFFCDKCHLATRRLDTIRHHPCDEDDKKRTGRDNSKRNIPYDFGQDVKIAQNGFKLMKKNGLAIMEKTQKPQHVKLVKFEEAFSPIKEITRSHRNIPSLQDLCCNALEFEDSQEGVSIDDIMTEPTTSDESPSKCLNHASSGTFCFKCKVLFNNYSDFQEHLNIESTTTPEFISVATEERTGQINPHFAYRQRRHIEVKRDVSLIHCTSCHAGNFESLDALYSHMVKCK